MFTWTLRHANTTTTNLIDPYNLTEGYRLDGSNPPELEVAAGYVLTDFMPIQIGINMQFNFIAHTLTYYDPNRVFMRQESNAGIVLPLVNEFFIRLAVDISGQGITDFTQMSLTPGVGSAFSPFYTERVVDPVYSTADRNFELQDDNQYYRDELDGNLSLVGDDYDYINALDFETKMILFCRDSERILPDFRGYFYKTNLVWNDDERNAELRTIDTDDNYDRILGSLSKEFNLVDIAPASESVTIRRRPIIQVYVAGDSALTSVIGGHWYEERLQVNPVFSNALLTNTYHFFNSVNFLSISPGYSTLLSTDVTGTYNTSRVNANGLYRVDEDLDASPVGTFVRRRYRLVRIIGNVTLYQTEFSDYFRTNIGTLLFEAVGAEIGSFYFTEFRVYVRYLTNLFDVGVPTSELPATDIVSNTRNYTRAVGYNVTTFQTYDQYEVEPTKFGRVPDDAPNAGEYFRQRVASLASGLSNPIPVTLSNWRTESLWFFNDIDVLQTEFHDGADEEIKDCYPLHEVIQALLNEVNSNLVFQDNELHSEVLYANPCPLGTFEYIDFDSLLLINIIAGNVGYYIVPKSNVITGKYTEPAQRQDISLEDVLNGLRDMYRIYWHIDGNNLLRLEHITWYQRGGTYNPLGIIGTNLTTLIEPKNNLSWSHDLNLYEYDKPDMPERYEFSWQDEVSIPFKGFDIVVTSEFVQEGNIEDVGIGNANTDVDYMYANFQDITREGLCFLNTVPHGDLNRVPYLEFQFTTQNVSYILQNGFLSWLYLHQKYHIYDKPSDNVNINDGEITVLPLNVTRQRTQDVEFPVLEEINVYELITTELGTGKIRTITIDMNNYSANAVIQHDTE